VIIYPGDHSGTNTGKGSPSGIAMAGPIPTIRLKMTRSGLQDWALFLLADRAGKRDMAKAAVASVYSQMGGCDYAGCKPLKRRLVLDDRLRAHVYGPQERRVGAARALSRARGLRFST
jgi:hypothetical protein